MTDDAIPQGTPGCGRCQMLHDEARFWHDQMKLAASVAANLADLNDYDQRVASLRSLLAKETERRRAAEHEAAGLAYKLQVATGTQA